jgi:hypothetical protein
MNLSFPAEAALSACNIGIYTDGITRFDRGDLCTRLFNNTAEFMPQDDGGTGFRFTLQDFDIRPANSTGLDPKQNLMASGIPEIPLNGIQAFSVKLHGFHH